MRAQLEVDAADAVETAVRARARADAAASAAADSIAYVAAVETTARLARRRLAKAEKARRAAEARHVRLTGAARVRAALRAAERVRADAAAAIRLRDLRAVAAPAARRGRRRARSSSHLDSGGDVRRVRRRGDAEGVHAGAVQVAVVVQSGRKRGAGEAGHAAREREVRRCVATAVFGAGRHAGIDACAAQRAGIL